jgi:hypothetical protein
VHHGGQLTGACGGSNQFDSLNDNLGSITQLVSFSQHPTDPNTILAGAQDNGSPATSSSQGNMSWANVNSGEGGYNEINPGVPNQWFTSNTGVSIQRCAFGVDCRAQDFSSGLVVTNTTVGGDAAAFERALPVFQAMGKRVTHIGPSGHGQLAKLCNQILVAINLLGASEALVFAAKAGRVRSAISLQEKPAGQVRYFIGSR